MRLIFLTNFYPPNSRGGYELWCQEVAEGLRIKGHQVRVLTSNYHNSNQTQLDPDWVQRRLNLEMEFKEQSNVTRFFFMRKRLFEENVSVVNKLLESFDPDLICVWGMWNLDRSILRVVENQLPGRVVYYMGDYWPFLPGQFEYYWKAPSKNFLMKIPKKVLGFVALRMLKQEEIYQSMFEHTLFPSTFLQKEFHDRGLHPADSQVIYGAANIMNFTQHQKDFPKDNGLTLLYAGRLDHSKGVHTAIEAVAILVEKHQFTQFNLRIVGSGDSEYENDLRAMVRANNLEDFVSFHHPVPKSKMPELYSQSDILLFTSIWKEPFGRVLVEAMAAGVVVIGTSTGGAAEILFDGKTGLTFTPGDAGSLALQILSLSSNRDLFAYLSREGRKFVLEKFTSERMVKELEHYFIELLGEELQF